MTHTTDDALYIGIENPIEIRRALLESSKSLIRVLQANENRKDKKRMKQQLITELKATIKEVTQLINELKAQMPKVKISTLPKKQTQEMPPLQTAVPPTAAMHTQATAVARAARRAKPDELSEAQKLEKELQEIEAKLSQL